jgi:hypothetical protein
VIDHAFRGLGAQARFAGHHAANDASRRLLLKLGFVRTHEELYPEYSTPGAVSEVKATSPAVVTSPVHSYKRTIMSCGLEAGIDISLRMGCIKPCRICLQGIRGGLMYKLALGVVILAAMAWAQENSAVCGPDQTKFEAKRESHSHPTGSPEPGKALVYVFGDSELDNATIHIGGLITRVG